MSGNIKMALEALRSSRWRSMLTMLGIMIGIVSVTTIVSLGEGAKHGIVGQINQAGDDLITIRPGRPVKREAANLAGANLFGVPGTGSFGAADLATVESVEGIKDIVPFMYVSSLANRDDHEYDQGMIIGTGSDLPKALNHDIEYGSFFSPEDANKNGAVIGKRVAEELFQENVPVGKLFTIRGKVFVVRGVFKEFDASPLAPNSDYNTAIFIQHEVAQELTGDTHIFQILARPDQPETLEQAVTDTTEAMARAHEGQHDFAVLTQQDRLATAYQVLDTLTGFVAGIAVISLIVAGIGILNIMLVSVTERTHEIGIRKAVGATNRQIMKQFLTEAVILSLLGGILGVGLSVLTNWAFRIFTDFTPVLTWPIMAMAVGVAVAVGVVFGTTPALKAAHKNPIDALRYE